MKNLVLFFMIMMIAACSETEGKKEIIAAPGAPKAIGPYSQAVKFEEEIFVSGQLGIDPATGKPKVPDRMKKWTTAIIVHNAI